MLRPASPGSKSSSHPPSSPRTIVDKLTKRKTWMIPGCLSVVLLAGVIAYQSHWWTGSATSPVRITVSGGCPASLGNHNGVSNGGLGFWFEMVPRNPTRAMVCDYPPAPPPPMSQATLTGPEAERLSAAADSSSTYRPHNNGCAWSGGNITVVAFSYQGRSDVDLWFEPGDCGLLTNGRLKSSNAQGFANLLQDVRS